VKNPFADCAIDRRKRRREQFASGRRVLRVQRAPQFLDHRTHPRSLRTVSLLMFQGLLRSLQYRWFALLDFCWCARRHSILPSSRAQSFGAQSIYSRSLNISRAIRLCQTAARAAACLLLIFLFLHVAARPARAEKFDQLQPQGAVNDFANALTPDTVTKLNALATELNDKADAQLDIVTVHTTEGDAVADYTTNLAEKWGVGYKGKDRGVMILLAVDDHQYFTAVGYGLEPILPDGKVGDFGRQMVPLLKSGDTSAAVLQLAGQVAAVIAQDRGVALDAQPPAPPASDDDDQSQPHINIALIFFGIWLLFFLFRIIRNMFGHSGPRRPGLGGWWWLGGMGGGGGGGFGGGGGGGGFGGGFGGGGFGGGGAGGGW
jgi:uncharacterized protein